MLRKYGFLYIVLHIAHHYISLNKPEAQSYAENSISEVFHLTKQCETPSYLP